MILTAVDSSEDMEIHLPRAVLHTESGVDLIPANNRLSDAAARLQVMRMSQYEAAKEAEQHVFRRGAFRRMARNS